MISDTLFYAIDEIKGYQKWNNYTEVVTEIEKVKMVMTALQVLLDCSPPTPEHELYDNAVNELEAAIEAINVEGLEQAVAKVKATAKYYRDRHIGKVPKAVKAVHLPS